MRGATDCAKRLKSLFNSLRSRLGKVSLPPATSHDLQFHTPGSRMMTIIHFQRIL